MRRLILVVFAVPDCAQSEAEVANGEDRMKALEASYASVRYNATYWTQTSVLDKELWDRAVASCEGIDPTQGDVFSAAPAFVAASTEGEMRTRSWHEGFMDAMAEAEEPAPSIPGELVEPISEFQLMAGTVLTAIATCLAWIAMAWIATAGRWPTSGGTRRSSTAGLLSAAHGSKQEWHIGLRYVAVWAAPVSSAALAQRPGRL